MTAATRIPLSDVHAQESHEAIDVIQSLAPIRRKSKELPRMGLFSFIIYVIDFNRAWRATYNNIKRRRKTGENIFPHKNFNVNIFAVCCMRAVLFFVFADEILIAAVFLLYTSLTKE